MYEFVKLWLSAIAISQTNCQNIAIRMYAKLIFSVGKASLNSINNKVYSKSLILQGIFSFQYVATYGRNYLCY